MKSEQQVRQEAEQATGLMPAQYFADQKQRIAELDTLNKEYSNTVAQRDASLAKEQDRLAPLSVINGRTAQITRQYAPELNRMSANINSKAAVMEALKGNFAEAQKYVQQAVDAFTAQKKDTYDQYVALREANRDVFDLLDADYKNAYVAAENYAKTSFENARADKTAVLNLMIQNPQAGILATDTLEQASSKASLNPKTTGDTVGSADTGYFNIVRDSQGNIVSKTPITTGGVSDTSSLPVDKLQSAIDSGLSANDAALDVAAYYDSLGVNVSEATIGKWTKEANKLKKTPAAMTSATTSNMTNSPSGTSSMPAKGPVAYPFIANNVVNAATLGPVGVGSFFGSLFSQ
jgi:hypothetical protein